jgi:LysM repeat protein
VSRAADPRRRIAHYAAPVLLLALVTVAVLLIRSGLDAGSTKTTTRGATQNPARTVVTRRHRHAKPRAIRYYTVQTGDTFGAIAAKTGVPVSQLERLNPGISSNALQIGQKLRVK